MAEIKIQEKKRSHTGLWLFIILLLIIGAVLVLDATESISTPDWIHQSANTGIDDNSTDLNY